MHFSRTPARLSPARLTAALLPVGLLTMSVVLATPAAAHADAAAPVTGGTLPADAQWTQEYIKEANGTVLHADILRPKGIAADTKTPVILSVGPYFNHWGQEGIAEGLPTRPASASTRFFDFVNGAHLMEKGYTFAMVDLSGFGGSTGCHDWMGPTEQNDVQTAVDWATSAPWSDGNVGMYGKSYDAVTGLIGVGLRPKGLKAVVAQEPVYDGYRYLYMNGIPKANREGTPQIYDTIAATPGVIGIGPGNDTLQYNLNAISDWFTPGCLGQTSKDALDADHNAPYWQKRNLISLAQGSNVPLFLTQGFIEDNTKADGTEALLKAHTGPTRAWLGQWNHVRGNDVDGSGRLAMGRPGWFDEVMRFYDQYLKGITPSVKDPAFVVEGNDGKWHAQNQWPSPSAAPTTITIPAGSYVDSGHDTSVSKPNPMLSLFGKLFGAKSDDPKNAVWSVGKPVTTATRISGTPSVSLAFSTLTSPANVAVDLYDVAPTGVGTLVSYGGYRISGSSQSFGLTANDWTIAPGHRIAIRVTDTNTDQAAPVPSNQTVNITGGSFTLPIDPTMGTPTAGTDSIFLDSYLKVATYPVPSSTS